MHSQREPSVQCYLRSISIYIKARRAVTVLEAKGLQMVYPAVITGHAGGQFAPRLKEGKGGRVVGVARRQL